MQPTRRCTAGLVVIPDTRDVSTSAGADSPIHPQQSGEGPVYSAPEPPRSTVAELSPDDAVARAWAPSSEVSDAHPSAGDAPERGREDSDGGAGAGARDDDRLPIDATGDDDREDLPSEWRWVREWRESGEVPAWGPGIALAAFIAVLVGCAVFVLSVGLSDMAWLAVVANVVVAGGLAPALWLSRSLPVLRFLAGGAAAGVVVGWIAALLN